MRIPRTPYHELSSQLLLSLITGGDCLQYNSVPVHDYEIAKLSPVEGSVYALIVVEADPSTMNKDRVIRFCEMQSAVVSAMNGMPLGDLSVYEVKGLQNMLNFQAIGIEEGKSHLMRVQYFG